MAAKYIDWSLSVVLRSWIVYIKRKKKYSCSGGEEDDGSVDDGTKHREREPRSGNYFICANLACVRACMGERNNTNRWRWKRKKWNENFSLKMNLVSCVCGRSQTWKRESGKLIRSKTENRSKGALRPHRRVIHWNWTGRCVREREGNTRVNYCRGVWITSVIYSFCFCCIFFPSSFVKSNRRHVNVNVNVWWFEFEWVDLFLVFARYQMQMQNRKKKKKIF